MKLIVGLGNPGGVYTHSRHNIGFSVVKALGKVYKIALRKKGDTFSLIGKVKIGREDVILAVPLTFMNLSGIAVSALVKKYKIDLPCPYAQERDLNNLLVVCDDLDLDLGKLKIRPSGSSGGHRGLESIIDYLNCQKFCRLRIGIGKPKDNADAAGYVLSQFTKKEKTQVKEAIDEAIECCRVWVTKGITESMNIFNRRKN